MNLTPEQQTVISTVLAAERGAPTVVHGPPHSGRSLLCAALVDAFNHIDVQALVVTATKARAEALLTAYPGLPVTAIYSFGLSLLRSAGFGSTIDENKTSRLASAQRFKAAKEGWYALVVEQCALGVRARSDMPSGGDELVAASLTPAALRASTSFMDMILGPVALNIIGGVPLLDAYIFDDVESMPPAAHTLIRRLTDKPPPLRRPYVVAMRNTLAGVCDAATLHGNNPRTPRDLSLTRTFRAPAKLVDWARTATRQLGVLNTVAASTEGGTVTSGARSPAPGLNGSAFLPVSSSNLAYITEFARRAIRMRFAPKGKARAWIERQRKIGLAAISTVDMMDVERSNVFRGEPGWNVVALDELPPQGAAATLLVKEYQSPEHAAFAARVALSTRETLAVE